MVPVSEEKIPFEYFYDNFSVWSFLSIDSIEWVVVSHEDGAEWWLPTSYLYFRSSYHSWVNENGD